MTAVRHLGALALYAALSLWLYGGPLLDGSDTYLGLGNDAEIFMWSFAWWPHAVAEGIDPVVTHAVWAPEGMNLMWATSVPTAAALLAPVTAAWGPVVSWNVAAVATPALAAFTAYLLCAHVARAWAPSVLGGALFGFSSYVAGQQLGHLHMTAVFLVPLGALLVVRRCEGSIGRWWFVALFALLLVAQLGLSTEVLLTGTLALAIGLALAAWTLRERRPSLRATARDSALAYLGCALLASPLLLRALTGFESDSINSPFVFSADLLNLVVPTGLARVSFLEDIAVRFRGNAAENGAYIGIPLLVAAALALRRPRSPRTRLLGLLLIAALVAALGPLLRVAGVPAAPLPWLPLTVLPPFTHVLPVRLIMFATLALGVLLACWLAERRSLGRYALVIVGLLLVLPDTGATTLWRSADRTPPLFRSDAWRAPLEGQSVLALPLGARGHSMLWQATADMGFDQTGGYLRPKPPARYDAYPVVQKLLDANALTAEDGPELQRLLDDTGTTVVAVDEATLPQFAPGLAAAGLAEVGRPGRVVLFRTGAPS